MEVVFIAIFLISVVVVGAMRDTEGAHGVFYFFVVTGLVSAVCIVLMLFGIVDFRF